ncbi:hypothetical protein CDAR_173291 [Caerostris darwini]|uniref:Uncharacterized protein n=1 Tax=Caerostris darwini TaxID=1538125 RepID=A0AAV4WLB7_9ARAC|nr:hypothetical protein CDAR_173291 [Caerostris darwini]
MRPPQDSNWFEEKVFVLVSKGRSIPPSPSPTAPRGTLLKSKLRMKRRLLRNQEIFLARVRNQFMRSAANKRGPSGNQSAENGLIQPRDADDSSSLGPLSHQGRSRSPALNSRPVVGSS